MARFASVNDDELCNIIDEKDSKNTKRGTAFAKNLMLTYCNAKNLDFSLISGNKEAFNDFLRKFYVEIRKEDGTLYKKKSFQAIRFGIQRFIKSINTDWDVIDGPEFAECNKVYQAQIVQLKKQGFAKVDHKPPIAPGDMEKLYSSTVFSLSHPKSLQRKVFFELVLFLCRRGQENLRELKKSDFVVLKDSNGIEYIMKSRDEFDKNHRGNTDDDEDGGIILATGTEYCPVRSFKLYLNKLNPKVDFLFQRPRATLADTTENSPWYVCQVLGIKTIEGLMKAISVDAQLSYIYTNHSIRATSITTLDQYKFEARHILTVSGHKSANSLKTYARTGLETKQAMSAALSAYSTKASCTPSLVVENSEFDISDQEMVNIAEQDAPKSSLPREKVLPMKDIINLPQQERLKQLSKMKNFHFCPEIEAGNPGYSGSNVKNQQAVNSSCKEQIKCNDINSIFGVNTQHQVFYNCSFNITPRDETK